MADVDNLLVENEVVFFVAQTGLFGKEKLYITNLRSIKVIIPWLFGRKTFSILPHSAALGQGLIPVWNWGVIIFGLLATIITWLIGVGVGGRGTDVPFFIVLSILIFIATILKARITVFAIFGQPFISMVIQDSEVEKVLKLVTKLQDDLIRNIH